MARITITIKTDNAAFGGDDYGPEVARILRALALRIEYASEGERDDEEEPVFDVNGNRVGSMRVES